MTHVAMQLDKTAPAQPQLGLVKLSLGSFRLGLELSLGTCRFETVVHDLSIWNFGLDSVTWDLSLGIFRLGAFAWDPSPGNFGWDHSFGATCKA